MMIVPDVSLCQALFLATPHNNVDGIALQSSPFLSVRRSYLNVKHKVPRKRSNPVWSMHRYVFVKHSAHCTRQIFVKPVYLFWKCLNCLTDECVSDHSERIRSIQIDKNFITQTFRIYNFIISRTVRNIWDALVGQTIQTFSIMRVQNKILLQKLYICFDGEKELWTISMLTISFIGPWKLFQSCVKFLRFYSVSPLNFSGRTGVSVSQPTSSTISSSSQRGTWASGAGHS